MAQRAVPGTVAAVEAALTEWMEEKELFCVQRRQPGRITWEPLGGMAAAVRRSTAAFSRGSAAMMLARADTVSATVVALEPGWCHVDAHGGGEAGARASSSAAGAALAGAGVLGAGLMVVLGALLPVALLPVPVALGVGYGVARQYRPTLARIQLGPRARARPARARRAACGAAAAAAVGRAARHAGGGDPAVAAVGERGEVER